jgi:hypothetical protein
VKYLKTFEYLIKKTDSVAINNPLREFSERIKNIIELFKNSSNGFKLKLLFDSSGGITIAYNFGKLKLLNIKLAKVWKTIEWKFDENIVEMTVKSDENQLIDKEGISIDFHKFINNKLKKYTNDDDNFKNWNNESFYRFPISEIDNIIKEIEEYRIQINANKFNI